MQPNPDLALDLSGTTTASESFLLDDISAFFPSHACYHHVNPHKPQVPLCRAYHSNWLCDCLPGTSLLFWRPPWLVEQHQWPPRCRRYAVTFSIRFKPLCHDHSLTVCLPVIATIFTLALAIFSVVTSRKQNPFSGGTRTRTVMLLAGEIVVFLLWVASAVLMLRSKGGCADWVTMEGTAYCPDKKKRDDVPNIQWFISVAFAFVEM